MTGAFGFDWMRPHYREICEDYELLKKKYTPFTIDGEEYFTPWLSMFPGQKDVTLQLKVDVNEGTPKDDDIITLPATGGIRFEPAQVKVSEADGREITVHCEAPVATNTGIQLLDKDGETVGKINIFKNANHAQLQFDIIPVRILRGSSQKADAATIEGQIDTGFGNHSTNLSADLQNLQHYLNHHCLNQALLQCQMGPVRDVVIDEAQWVADGLIVTDDQVFKGDEVLDRFYEAFEQQHPQASQKKGVVVFMSPLQDIEAGGKGDTYDIDSKVCVIYQSNLRDKQTFAHEIGHVLGLRHSFMKFNKQTVNDYNKFVKQVDDKFNNLINNNVSKKEIAAEWNKVKELYEDVRGYLQLYYHHFRDISSFDKGETENFMDYVSNPRSLWKHQWDVMQSEVLKFY